MDERLSGSAAPPSFGGQLGGVEGGLGRACGGGVGAEWPHKAIAAVNGAEFVPELETGVLRGRGTIC